MDSTSTKRWSSRAICSTCWVDREGDRVPHRLREPDAEHCVICGRMTASGIYIRWESSQ
jgi:hypothetical protein